MCTVVLTLPEAFTDDEVPELVSQLNEVFAPPTDITTGWLTLTAEGLQAYADTSDVGGAPDYVAVVGTVVLTPGLVKPIRRVTTGELFFPSAVTATFDSNGVLSYDGVADVRVVAPQWSELSRTDWKWTAEVKPGPGQAWQAWGASFSGAPGATINLANFL